MQKEVLILDSNIWISYLISRRLAKLCQFEDTDETVHNLTDPKDNFLLNLYNKGKATLLVSGDKKFLHEAKELNFQVMTLREFEESFCL